MANPLMFCWPFMPAQGTQGSAGTEVAEKAGAVPGCSAPLGTSMGTL